MGPLNRVGQCSPVSVGRGGTALTWTYWTEWGSSHLELLDRVGQFSPGLLDRVGQFSPRAVGQRGTVLTWTVGQSGAVLTWSCWTEWDSAHLELLDRVGGAHDAGRLLHHLLACHVRLSGHRVRHLHAHPAERHVTVTQRPAGRGGGTAGGGLNTPPPLS